MTSLDKNTAQPFDDVDDLTRFADESFDTEEINLFEFTDQEDSPLTRLKSVILSLEWEISDEILDELAEEIADQKSQREGDKVAQIYLQALEKVGKYLKAEGAYAHPNAIKLLLTLYYNYEKISSSPDITGDEITLLLKSDIRKFKVLQFQIGGMQGGAQIQSADEVVSSKETSAVDDEPCEFLDCIHATILGLEWEVTDEGLEKFNRQADQLREKLLDNSAAQILVQGLQALGAYIREEKIHAHPDAFTLLHSFYEGLKILALDEDLDSKQRQEILIDKVSRLNNLKEIIAEKKSRERAEQPAEEGDQILDFENTEKQSGNDKVSETPISEDKDTLADDALEFVPDADHEIMEDEPVGELSDAELFLDDDKQQTTSPVGIAMETAVDKYPEDILEPDAIQPVSDTIADDLIEEELGISSKETFSPESIENPEESAEDSPGKQDLEEQLELIFSDDEEGQQAQGFEKESIDDVFDDLALGFDSDDSDDTSSIIAESDKELPDIEEDLFLDAENNTALSFADIEKEEQEGEDIIAEELNTEHSLSLDNELDSLLGSFGEEESQSQEEATHADDLPPALSDTDNEDGFNEELTASDLGDNSSEELQDKLDSLFGSSDEDSTIFLEEELDSLFKEEEAPDTNEETSELSVALEDAEEESGFSEELTITELGDNSSEELQDKLDSLFGSSDEDVEDTLEEEIDSLLMEDEVPEQDEQNLRLSESPADDDDQITFDEEGQTETIHDAAVGVTVISSLVSAAEKVATEPDPENIQQITTLVATGKQENPSPQQEVLLTLIDSTATLLTRNPEATVGRSAIIQELIAGFEDAENPATLVEAVNRYTRWQLDFFTACTDTKEKIPATDDHIISTVEDGFTKLREIMMKEFETLKKELKQE